jgi:hypothetical protein
MTKRIIANRFGLAIALTILSLTASTTAFAAAAQGPQQVVVTNTPAQPVPVVGLIKDSDAPARKSLQTNFFSLNANQPKAKVISVPANQLLAIEHVSGRCNIVGNGWISISAQDHSTQRYHGAEFLPDKLLHSAISSPIRFYVDPGMDLNLINVDGGNGAQCQVSLSGYFVNLP